MRPLLKRAAAICSILILGSTLLTACGTKGALTLPTTSDGSGTPPSGGNPNTAPLPAGSIIR